MISFRKLNVGDFFTLYNWFNVPHVKEFWYQNEQTHRENGPALTSWYENGNKKSEKWYQDGQRHRNHTGNNAGPSGISWDEDGKKWSEE